MKWKLIFLFLTLFISAYGQDLKQGISYLKNQEYKKAAEFFQVLLPEVKKQYGSLDTVYYAKILTFLARSYKLSGNQQKAEEYYLQAIQVYELYGDSYKNFYYQFCVSELAYFYLNLKNYSNAEFYFLKLLEIYKKAKGEKTDDYVITLLNLAELYKETENFKKAEKLYEKTLILAKDVFAQQEFIYADILEKASKFYSKIKKYEKAEELLMQSVMIKRKILGRSSINYYSALTGQALIFKYKKDYKNSEATFYKALKIRQEIMGEDDPACGYVWLELANLYLKQDKYQKALKASLSAVYIFEKNMPQEADLYGEALFLTGRLYLITDNLKEAEYYLKLSAQVQKQYFGLTDYYIASLNFLAEIYKQLQNYSLAEKYLLEALEYYKQKNGENHPLFLAALENVIDFYQFLNKKGNYNYWLSNEYNLLKKYFSSDTDVYVSYLFSIANTYIKVANYSKAKMIIDEIEKLSLSYYGKFSVDYAQALNLLGAYFIATGDFQNALFNFSEAKKILEKIGVNKYLETYFYSLKGIALVYDLFADFEMAEKFYLNAFDIAKKIDTLSFYKAALDLVSFYKEIGYYQKAKEYFNKTMNFSNDFVYFTDFYVNFVLKFSDFYILKDDYESALTLLTQTLDNIQRKFGKYNLSYFNVLRKIAIIYKQKGDFDAAQDMFLQANDIVLNVVDKNSVYYASFLKEWASLYFDKKEFDKALKLYLKAWDIEKNFLEPVNSDYIASVMNIGLTYWALGDLHKASYFFEQADSLKLVFVRKNFSFMSDKQKSAYWDIEKIDFEQFNSFYLLNEKKFPQLGGWAYNNALFEKGILLRSSIALNKVILQSGDTALIADYQKFKELSATLYNELSKNKNEQIFNVDSLENVIEDLQKKIIEKSKHFDNFMDAISTSWIDVKNKLDDDEAAIEYLTFNFYDNERWTDSVFYIALVLKKNFEYPKIIFLCEQDSLDKILSQNWNYDDEFQKIESIYEYDFADDLYRLIWQPFDSLLFDVKKIYISPAGLIYKIPLAVLPDTNNLKIIDKYQISILSSTSYLLSDLTFNLNPNDTLIFFGGIDYDNSDTSRQTVRSLFASRSSLFAGKFSKAKFLQGTDIEVDNLSKLSKENGFNFKKYKGKIASEYNFKSLSGKNYSIIHIATHGFYIQDTSNFYYWKNPLNRSGLLFSGANNTLAGNYKEAADDGILTAAEMSDLNFYNTNLIVLSACQTALGDINGNEGVFGLQRGVKMSGIDFMIVSLWSVSDYVTMIFMQKFYENLFLYNNPEKAYLKTILEIKNAGYFAYGNKVIQKKGYESQVYFWAPFILIR